MAGDETPGSDADASAEAGRVRSPAGSEGAGSAEATADVAPPVGSGRAMLAAALGTGLLFVLVQVGALALVDPFVSAGYQQVDDPTDPTNSALYLGVILVATGGILLVVRLGVEGVLKAVILLTSGLLSWYALSVIVPAVLPGAAGQWVAAAIAAGVVVALYVHPEWYVIDAAGVLMAAGGAALFGISFGPLPALLLLAALAVYDALAVYGTEHMLTLAESVTDLKLPLVLVVPLSLSYSFLEDDPMEAGSADDADAADAEAAAAGRDAFFIGLGDTVIPTVLVASAAVFTGAPSLGVPGLALTMPALLAMLGTLAGLAGLLWMVAKGRAHAGLPLLNGGAIAGYLVGAIVAGVPLVEAVGLGPYL